MLWTNRLSDMPARCLHTSGCGQFEPANVMERDVPGSVPSALTCHVTWSPQQPRKVEIILGPVYRQGSQIAMLRISESHMANKWWREGSSSSPKPQAHAVHGDAVRVAAPVTVICFSMLPAKTCVGLVGLELVVCHPRAYPWGQGPRAWATCPTRSLSWGHSHPSDMPRAVPALPSRNGSASEGDGV